MDNNLLLEMPVFRPEYKKWMKYGYRIAKEKNNLKIALEISSGGYCMYCYSRVRVDGKSYANLEHAIEKANSDKLIECIPNIGLSCPTCNQIFKKAGEKRRRLSNEIIKRFEDNSRCTLVNRKQCRVPCKALKELQKQYTALPEGKIILQPIGIKGEDTGETLALQYDTFNMEFQPASDSHTYSLKEKNFIDFHIKRFRLNDPKYRTRALYEFIQNIIDNDGKIPQYEYNNMIVEQFCKQMKGKSSIEILKICKSIFSIAFLKM